MCPTRCSGSLRYTVRELAVVAEVAEGGQKGPSDIPTYTLSYEEPARAFQVSCRVNCVSSQERYEVLTLVL